LPGGFGIAGFVAVKRPGILKRFPRGGGQIADGRGAITGPRSGLGSQIEAKAGRKQVKAQRHGPARSRNKCRFAASPIAVQPPVKNLRIRCCQTHALIYSGILVRLHWKVLRIAICAAVFLLLGAGCSGINVTKSVSPATFLLPGLMQNDAPPVRPDPTLPAVEPPQQVAQF